MNLQAASKLFKIGIKVLIGIVAGYYLWILLILPASKGAVKSLFPPKNPPNPAYGVLPALEFVEKNIIGTPVYELNTRNGRLPTGLPIKLSVYRFYPAKFSYEAGKNARETAAALGFTDNEMVTDLKGNIYRWKNVSTGSILEIDSISKDLKLETDLTRHQNQYENGELNLVFLKEKSKEIMSNIQRFNDELYKTGTQTTSLGKIQGNKVVTSDSPFGSQLVRIDFFRSIEKYMILGPDPKKGLMSITLSNQEQNSTPRNNPFAYAYYHEIETEAHASYPIVSVDQAWNLVKQGRGVIAGVLPKGSSVIEEHATQRVDKILIDSVYLAYYETPTYQKFLQPIYVFEGKYTSGSQNGTISIYYPAITSQYIETPEPVKK